MRIFKICSLKNVQICNIGVWTLVSILYIIPPMICLLYDHKFAPSELSYVINLNTPFGEGNANPLQYSCLENPTDRGTWGATVHGGAKSGTRLSEFTFHFWTISGFLDTTCQTSKSSILDFSFQRGTKVKSFTTLSLTFCIFLMELVIPMPDVSYNGLEMK